jgi:indole-3-glycerol phosphate synthase
MTVTRRLSQAISEGDGISVIVEVDGAVAARAAEDGGAEAVVATSDVLTAIRDATSLPIIWRARADERADTGAAGGADACLVSGDGFEDDDSPASAQFSGAQAAGLECVVRVSSADDLEAALDALDPEIFLLAPPEDDDERVERVLDLLPDVPAGKLAIADLGARSRDEVEELERAGVDGVIVGAGNVADFVGAAPPEV